MVNSRRIILSIASLILLFCIIAGIHWLIRSRSHAALPANAPGTALPGTGPVTIILSPDFGDAVLSLGGLLAQHARPAIVATFFTGEPSPATSTAADQVAGFTDSTVAGNVRAVENQHALNALGAVPENYGYVSGEYGQPIDSGTLETDIAQDIQALLVANAGRQLYVYGPADFGSTTNADTQALHDAFTDAAAGFPDPAVQFFYYEAYPAVTAFNAASFTSLQNFLQNESGLFLTTVDIALSNAQVGAKIGAVKQYQSLMQAFAAGGQNIADEDQSFTETRCAGTACEVVYQIATSTAI